MCVATVGSTGCLYPRRMDGAHQSPTTREGWTMIETYTKEERSAYIQGVRDMGRLLSERYIVAPTRQTGAEALRLAADELHKVAMGLLRDERERVTS